MPLEMKSEDRCIANVMDNALKLFSRTGEWSLLCKGYITTVGQFRFKRKRNIIRSMLSWVLDSRPRQSSSRGFMGFPG